jgi:hypothetical protein
MGPEKDVAQLSGENVMTNENNEASFNLAEGPSMSGGRRRSRRSRHHRKSHKRTHRGGKKHRHSKKCGHTKKSRGGEGILATAAVPFGLTFLNKYFKNRKPSGEFSRRTGQLRRTGRRFRRALPL